MILPNRVTAVVGKITDIQAREAVSRFLRRWQRDKHVFTTGSLRAAHRIPPTTKVCLKFCQVPGADLASWTGDSATQLEWLIDSISKVYKKTGQLNPSIRSQLEYVVGRV
jgi:hypothetical protein